MHLRSIAFVMAALLPAATRAGDATTVIDKAIQATARSELILNRLSNVLRTERGVLHLPGEDVPADRTSYLNPPLRIRYDATLVQAGQRVPFVLTLDGVNGWKSIRREVSNLTAGEMAAIQDDRYVWYVASLLPTKRKEATLTMQPDATINNSPVSVVKLTMPGRTDAQLYFDKKTGLLVRIRMQSSEPGVGPREWDFSEFKDFDGIKLPTKYSSTQRNRKIEEWTIDNYRFRDRFVDSTFEKPK